MIQLPERFHLPVPEHWTPQQALAVFALLNELTDAIWPLERLANAPTPALFEQMVLDPADDDLAFAAFAKLLLQPKRGGMNASFKADIFPKN